MAIFKVAFLFKGTDYLWAAVFFVMLKKTNWCLERLSICWFVHRTSIGMHMFARCMSYLCLHLLSLLLFSCFVTTHSLFLFVLPNSHPFILLLTSSYLLFHPSLLGQGTETFLNWSYLWYWTATAASLTEACYWLFDSSPSSSGMAQINLVNFHL